MGAEGWPYQDPAKRPFFLCRDRALVSLLYVGELRVSEALRITIGQFEDSDKALVVHDVLLSKTKKKMIYGSNARYRDLMLPKNGERACFTRLIQDYLTRLQLEGRKNEDRLFPWSLQIRKVQVGTYTWRKEGKTTPLWSVKMVGTTRAWQVVNALLPDLTQHWLRVYGEKYLYKMFDKDIIAVAKVVKVDPRTAIKYLMAGTENYPVV